MHRFTKTSVGVDVQHLQPAPPPDSRFVIEDNFSETNARLTVSDQSYKGMGIKLGPLFREQVLAPVGMLEDEKSSQKTSGTPSTSPGSSKKRRTGSSPGS
eukprot:4011564-Amphidinium_carterae.1